MRKQPIRPNPCNCGAKYELGTHGLCITFAVDGCEIGVWIECNKCGAKSETHAGMDWQKVERACVNEWNESHEIK